METFQEKDIDIEEIKRVIETIIEEAITKCILIQGDIANYGLQFNFWGGLPLWPGMSDFTFGEEESFTDEVNRDEEVFLTPQGGTPPSEDEDEPTDQLHSNQVQINSKYFQPYNCDKDYYKNEVLLGEDYCQNSEEDEMECSPTFTTEWCFGISLRVPLLYLPQRETFFAASHMGVLYNSESQSMKFLQGLTGEVSCAACGGGYLTLADTGPGKCAVVLWDSKGLTPQRCWVEALPGGASLLHLSPCGAHLTAVSAPPTPVLIRWSLNSSDSPTAIPLPEGTPVHLTYSLKNPNKCAVTYPKQLIILELESSKNSFELVKAGRPKSSAKTGLYRTSVFTNLDSQIVVGTSLGQVIIWTQEGNYLKTLKLHRTGVTWLQLVSESIVIAFEDGSVWSYDQEMRMRSWFSLSQSPITSLSFLENPQSTISEFAFSTVLGSWGIVSNRSKPSHFLYNVSACILSIECHPNNHTFVTGDAQGKVTLYHLKTKQKELEKIILGCGISVLAFSPTGAVLAAGSEQGDLLLLDPILLTTRSVLPSARAAISHIIFTNNGKRLVYVHKASGIGLFKFTVDWNTRGKFRPHCKSITGVDLVGDRLFTVGEDRMVAELNVKHMLRFIGRFKVEQTAIPTCCVFYEGQLMVANSDCRLRFVNVEKKEIMRTIRSPGSAPIHIMKLVNDRQLFYATGQEIGTCDLKGEGWTPGMVAHPRKVTHVCPFPGGVLTTGQGDTVIFKWSFNHRQPISKKLFFPQFQDQAINRIFNSGPIPTSQIFYHLCFLGYFPSKFDISNILRELDSDEVDETSFRQILWNHGPPPGISFEDLRNTLLSVSDIVRMSGPLVQTERLFAALESGDDGEGMSRAEAQRCLRVLSAPGLIPLQIPLEKFMTDILGVDPNLSDE